MEQLRLSGVPSGSLFFVHERLNLAGSLGDELCIYFIFLVSWFCFISFAGIFVSFALFLAYKCLLLSLVLRIYLVRNWCFNSSCHLVPAIVRGHLKLLNRVEAFGVPR